MIQTPEDHRAKQKLPTVVKQITAQLRQRAEEDVAERIKVKSLETVYWIKRFLTKNT